MAEVFVNTSLSEGQSSAILEAMALGTPVFARDIPGNRALLRAAGGQTPGETLGEAHPEQWEAVNAGVLFSSPNGFERAVRHDPRRARATRSAKKNYLRAQRGKSYY